MTKLPYKVECKSTVPYFELIAAFNCEPAAVGYAIDCRAANNSGDAVYRVRKGKKIIAVCDRNGLTRP